MHTKLPHNLCYKNWQNSVPCNWASQSFTSLVMPSFARVPLSFALISKTFCAPYVHSCTLKWCKYRSHHLCAFLALDCFKLHLCANKGAIADQLVSLNIHYATFFIRFPVKNAADMNKLYASKDYWNIFYIELYLIVLGIWVLQIWHIWANFHFIPWLELAISPVELKAIFGAGRA